jgi:hypothetical protein
MAEIHSDVVGGSSADRVVNCPGSVKLSKQVPPQEASDFANQGSMLHEVIAKILSGNATAEELIDQEFEFLGHVFTDDLNEEMIQPALAAFDELADEFGDFEFVVEVKCEFGELIPGAFGTTDILGENTEVTIVLDWKFGRGVPVDAEDNGQLKFYGAAATWTKNLKQMFSPDRKVILAIIQPAFDPPLSYWETDIAALNDYTQLIQASVTLAEGINPDLKEGDHCRWCPAKAICPLKVGMVEGVIDDQEMDTTSDNYLINVEDLPRLLNMAEELTQWVVAVKELGHAELERGTNIDGWKLVAKRKTRSWNDADVVVKRLKGMRLKTDQVYNKKLISPAQSDKLLKKIGKPGKLDDLITTSSPGTTMARANDPRAAITTHRAGADLALPDYETEPETGA